MEFYPSEQAPRLADQPIQVIPSIRTKDFHTKLGMTLTLDKQEHTRQQLTLEQEQDPSPTKSVNKPDPASALVYSDPALRVVITWLQ